MQKFASVLVFTLIASALYVAPAAATEEKDRSWWGHSDTLRPITPDSKGRSGYWWWPVAPKSNVGDQELWGNRGVVFSQFEPREPRPRPVEVTPQPPAPPTRVEPVEPIEVVRSIPVLNDVLFDFDKSVLKPQGKMETDKVISELKDHPGDTVLIEGHTCDIGTDEYNMSLGGRRANSVRDYMVSQGINSSRISTQSYGESQPAVPNTSEENRSRNRRAVFKITLAD